MQLVSIITVTYNSETYLEDTIKSVLNQSYKNIEYIIIDGASNDKTIDIIKKYEQQIAFWISEKDNGIYHAMNKGIRKAKGDIIGILNSDDWLMPDTVKKVVEASRATTETKYVVHGKIATYNSRGNLVAVRAPKKIPGYYLFSTPFKHPAMFVSSDIYQQIGLFDENCGLAADYDLMLRIIKNRILSIYVDETLTNVRLVGISTGGNSNATLRDLFRIIKKNTHSYLMAFIGITGRIINKKL